MVLLGRDSSDPSADLPKVAEPTVYSVAVGVITVWGENRPRYIYPTMTSLFESLFTPQHNRLLQVDAIHIFPGSAKQSYLDYFKYSSLVSIHSINTQEFSKFGNDSVHMKAAYNYARALRYLLETYPTHDAILLLEDDVIMHPSASSMIHTTMSKINTSLTDNWILDGYVADFQWPRALGLQDDDIELVLDLKYRCCTQAYLYSRTAALKSVGFVERVLNRTDEPSPYDLTITSNLWNDPTFSFFQVVKGWVQHIGVRSTGLGDGAHRGRTPMSFQVDED
ncbi:hypothetical protein HDV03_001247 [Kappamyces sp. JEL0829]|nr:hypothetical protein HDV03_001247 [Kappamyces sp. JEL0829]